MEIDSRRQKLDLVWASVFPAAFAIWALTIISSSGSDVQIVGLAMGCGLFLSVVTGSLLLLCGGSGRGLLVFGRILVVLQLLLQAAAFALLILAAILNA